MIYRTVKLITDPASTFFPGVGSCEMMIEAGVGTADATDVPAFGGVDVLLGAALACGGSVWEIVEPTALPG